MVRTVLVFVCVLVGTSWAQGDTNTPLPSGTSVAVTTTAGTVTGKLVDSSSPNWIAIVEAGRSDPSYVQLTGAVVRSEFGPISRDEPARQRAERSARTEVPVHQSREPRLRRGEEDFAEGHFIHGMPQPSDDRHKFTPDGQLNPVAGITVLVREAFTLGHYDKYKVPAWVAMRWTDGDLVASEAVNLGRPRFRIDNDLPDYARGGTSLEFNRTQLERGHMARDADLEAWGELGVRQGMLMSNIVPQRKGRGHVVWGKLEDAHRFIVADTRTGIDTVWITSGPVFDESETIELVGSGNGVPQATYKVIAWKGDEGELRLRGYVIGQEDTDTTLTNYLKTIDDVEAATGLDFFPELEDEIEAQLEAEEHQTLWEE